MLFVLVPLLWLGTGFAATRVVGRRGWKGSLLAGATAGVGSLLLSGLLASLRFGDLAAMAYFLHPLLFALAGLMGACGALCGNAYTRRALGPV